MDELEIVTEVLNSTLQRHGRLAQAYEVEIANLTAEIVRLRSQVPVEASLEAEIVPDVKEIKGASAKS